MIRGVYAAAAGMITQRERLDVIANNVANIGTTAFKKSLPVTQGFYQVFAQEVAGLSSQRGSGEIPGGGTSLDATAEDFSPGPIVDTGNSLDAAIDGPGFFAVLTPAGERYTRAGNFSLNSEGQLITQAGYPVLGEQGPIITRGGSISIAPSGDVIVDGVSIERIQVVDFPQPYRLQKYGNNLYGTDDETPRLQADNPNLRAGALEHSNVNPIAELTALIDANRTYEAQQRVITILNDSLGAAVNDIART